MDDTKALVKKFPTTPREQEKLIQRVRAGVRGLRMLSSDEAEDVTGIILLELVEKDRVVSRLWIRRRVLDFIRWKIKKSKDERHLAAVGSEQLVGDTTPQVLGKSQVDYIMAKAHLPKLLEQVVILRFYRGLTYDEIAKELGCCKATVAARLQSALEILRYTCELERISE